MIHDVVAQARYPNKSLEKPKCRVSKYLTANIPVKGVSRKEVATRAPLTKMVISPMLARYRHVTWIHWLLVATLDVDMLLLHFKARFVRV